MSEQASLEIVERSGRIAAARLAGDLDIVTSENVKRELAGLVDAGHDSLVLDLSDVGFARGPAPARRVPGRTVLGPGRAPAGAAPVRHHPLG